VLLLLAILFAFIKLPDIRNKSTEKAASKNVFHALRHRHLAWGVAAQFAYVGAQTCVFSLFVLYAPVASGITEKAAGDFLFVGGMAFLTGRFVGTFLMRYIKPQKLLAIYAFISALLCFPAIFGTGMLTVYTVIAIYFFMSIMFPTIFALGIQNLGADTEFGSSLLIMSIVGGAIIPRFFGYISDATGNIQYGYFVPMACFAFIILFGWKGHQVSQKAVENAPATFV
jgi:FHS family L-fucose permease-like MFS transporter